MPSARPSGGTETDHGVAEQTVGQVVSGVGLAALAADWPSAPEWPLVGLAPSEGSLSRRHLRLDAHFVAVSHRWRSNKSSEFGELLLEITAGFIGIQVVFDFP